MENHHPTLEAGAEDFLRHPDCFKHCLIGSLLSFIPIVNLFALGPINLSAFIGPSLCVSALFRYHQTKSFQSLLNLKALIQPLLEQWPRVLLANFCLLGFMGVFAPLYGVASFVGYAFYIYYMGGVVRR